MMLPLQRILRFPVSVVLFAYVLHLPSTHALSLDAEKVLLKRCTSAAVHRPQLCSSHTLSQTPIDQSFEDGAN